MMAATDREGAMPGYLTFLEDCFSSYSQYFTEKMRNVEVSRYPYYFYKDLMKYSSIGITEIVTCLSLAIIVTLLRLFLTKYFFLPVGRYFKLSQLNISKLPESGFKSIFYTSTWFYALYLLFFSGRYDIFQKPNLIWSDWSPNMDVPFDITILYEVEFAFYLHSVYACLRMDAWRKDSCVMLFHHFLTMALIGFSYASRYHKIGLLVLFMHDISDVCLESTKCHVYFKERGGKYYIIHDIMSTLGFLGFASTWFLCRLVWFPLKVIHSTSWGVMHFGPTDQSEPALYVPFYMFFNTMLWILLLLNVYWFAYIINFLWRVATGKMDEVDDIREEEVLRKCERKLKEAKARKSCSSNGSSDEATTNGVSATGDVRHRKK